MHSSDSLPPLDGIAAVIAAHRTGSFSAAAEMLGITHGAVSRRVHAVEHWLATPLFVRHGRGVQATPAGLRFVATAEQALAMLRDSADRWRRERDAPVVRLSVVPSFARLWLMPKMRFLQGEPQDVRVDVHLEHRTVDLASDEVDLAVRYTAGRSKTLVAHRLFGERLSPVAAPELARKLGSHAKAQRIAQLPLLHDSDTRQWRQWLASQNVRRRPQADDRRFEDYDLVLSACDAGLGVALLRSPLADAHVTSGRLVRVSNHSIVNERGHYIAIRPDEDRAEVLRVAQRLKAAAEQFSLLQ
jgi:DNA-binding transcriptional LysR family regulator